MVLQTILNPTPQLLQLFALRNDPRLCRRSKELKVGHRLVLETAGDIPPDVGRQKVVGLHGQELPMLMERDRRPERPVHLTDGYVLLTIHVRVDQVTWNAFIRGMLYRIGLEGLEVKLQ